MAKDVVVGRRNPTKVVSENLLDWADEIEEGICKTPITDPARLQLLVKDLHIAAGVLEKRH